MFKDNKVLILGLARSGYQAAKLLIKRGNEVYLNEAKEEILLDKEQVSELRELGVNLIFGYHPDDLLDSSFDYLIKNPGVPIDHKLVLQAKELGIEVINEVEMAYRLMPEDINLIAITGTNGKTTTTTMTYNILHDALGDKVHLAGNIGYPLCSILDEIKQGDIIVMEFSCQQGENIKEFKPHIALFTNLSSTHIDFMKTYEHYKEVKERMFFNQNEEDIAIINKNSNELIEDLKDIKSKIKYFSSTEKADCYLDGDIIYYNDEEVLNVNDLVVKGSHNYENVMSAITIVKEFDVSNESIKNTLKDFKGVEHRLEFVRKVNDIKFYNDTKATNIKSTQIALSSFNEPLVVILGGMERGQDFNELKDYLEYVDTIVAIGECRDRVEEELKDTGKDIFKFETLSEGFDKCVEVAKSKNLGVVLLSPASASWDQYDKFEDRGDEFKERVNNL